MPFKPSNAKRFTKKAKTPKLRRRFAKVANTILERSRDEGKAIRIANAAVRRG